MKKLIGSIVLAIVVIGIIFFIPYAVNWLFSKTAFCDLMIARWTEADSLGYGGDVLSFIGTVVLGAVAVYQTSKAHEQTDRANQLTQEALEQTKRANELAAKMQQLEESRFLSMIAIQDVRFKPAKAIDITNQKVPFMLDYEKHICVLDLTNSSNPSEYHVIDTIIENSSDFHTGTLSIVVEHLDNSWEAGPNRLGLASKGKLNARILIPKIDSNSSEENPLSIHFSFTNIFKYTTQLTLVIKDIENKDGKGSYVFYLEKPT